MLEHVAIWAAGLLWFNVFFFLASQALVSLTGMPGLVGPVWAAINVLGFVIGAAIIYGQPLTWWHGLGTLIVICGIAVMTIEDWIGVFR